MNMSFRMTTDQIRNRTKTVTRRLGWARLKPGTLLQPIVKGQGIPKGGKVETIGGPIRVVRVDREPLSRLLNDYKHGIAEVCREGFPEMTPGEFVVFFARSHGLGPRRGVFSPAIARAVNKTIVTRIEFEYVEPSR
jgi:hypothetical protein